MRTPHFFYVRCLLVLSFFFNASYGQEKEIKFKKHTINPVFVSEGAAVADINNDGKKDIIAGRFWYEAPEWKEHLIHMDTTNGVPGYSTTFLNFCSDVNNDGWQDVIRFDQPGGVCYWYENPGKKDAVWKHYLILATAGNESPTVVDVDNDGRPDIICNDPTSKKMLWLKSPTRKGDTSFTKYVISNDSLIGTNRYTHGLGWGDMNKDGKNDVIIKTGWWESPADVKISDWKFHRADLGKDCSNMFVLDVDRDGDVDLISSSAHNYGIWWYEQNTNEKNESAWIRHMIDSSFSQSHALRLADINGDGNPDLVTGKRYLAHHDGSDAGSYEPAVLYWFEFKAGKNPTWIPHQIDNNSGIGNSFVVEDMNNDGLLDIIVSNKKGVYLFQQLK